ncbi:AAA family ATPase [Archangium gephyra]|nr:AAA family ATPase [Archangium gephyra]
MTNEVINFRSEWVRHGDLLGREDILAELDRLLGQGGDTRGWVLVKGGPGMGKSALLAHYLARLHRSGQRIPHHFLRRGVQGWDRPEVAARNLAAQVEALLPEQAQPDARPELRLQENLQRISDEVLVPRGERLLLVVDGLDEAEPVADGQNPLPYFLPEVLPQGVHVLCASRPTYPYLSWLEAKDRVRRIDLDDERWAGSNEQVVRRYWDHVAPQFTPPLAPSLVQEAVRRANGNVLYTLKLSDWLQEQPLERRRVELLPQGLEAFLVEVWLRLQALPAHERTVAFTGLGLIAAAREALPLSVLATIAGWRDVEGGERFVRATRPFLLEEPESWGGERAWRPFHESFREFIARRLGVEGMRREHRRLAEHLCTWPVEAVGNDFRWHYALHHGVVHWVEAGDWQRVRSLCTDLGHLEMKCREAGVSAVEEDLSRAANVSREDDQGLLRELHRAVQTGSHWLRQDPRAMAQLVYNRLRTSRWTNSRIEELLRFPDGLPALRLRHAVRRSGGELRTLVGHETAVYGCALTTDGRRAISAADDCNLKVWDLETGRTLATLEGHANSVMACSVTPDGQRAVSASWDGTLKIWELETGSLLATLEGHTRPVLGCAVTADGQRVISASDDGTLKVWEPETGGVLATLEGHAKSVTACSVTPDGRRAVSASDDGTLKVWDLETNCALATLEGHTSAVTACAVTADGRRAVSASRDGSLKVWDLETMRALATLEHHTSTVTACAVTADGRRAVSVFGDGVLRVWELETGRALVTLEGHTAPVNACAVTADGRRAITASEDETLKVWDLEASRFLPMLEGHTGRVNACALSADGQRAVSGSDDSTLKVWDLETGEVLATLEGHTASVNACALPVDGRRALSASDDGTLKVWDLETRRALATLEGHNGAVLACAVTADGKRAVSASWDRTLKIWDLETGRIMATLEHHTGPVFGCAVTADGQRAVSTSDDGTLKVWDLETSHTWATVEGYRGPAYGCAVTADGRRAVSTSTYGALKVWDLDTGRVLYTLEHNEGLIYGCSVTTDSRRVVSASFGGTLKVWDLYSGECLQTLYGNGAFYSVATVGDVICAGDHLGNVWILEAKPRPQKLRTETTSEEKRAMDLGIVIALKEEFRVFRELLPSGLRAERDEKTGQFDYTFTLSGSPHSCVVSFIGEMNPENAALHTERLLSRWNPRTVVMLGIAAGLHQDVRVGDVVVASQVDNYLASAKALPGSAPGSFEFSLGGTVFQGDHDFITRVRNLEFAEREAFISWHQLCQESLAKHVPEQARTELVRQRLIRAEPELLDVHLASGPVVGAAQEFTRWLREKRDRNLKALDMESAGLMASAFKRVEPTRTLVIRGISDYGDERKITLDALGEGALRRHAMHNATTLLWILLRSGVLPSSST